VAVSIKMSSGYIELIWMYTICSSRVCVYAGFPGCIARRRKLEFLGAPDEINAMKGGGVAKVNE